MQSGQAAPSAPVALGASAGSHPLWNAGLTGSGLVIGGGDSNISALVPCSNMEEHGCHVMSCAATPLTP